MEQLGSKIAVIATPLARAFGLPCIDEETKQLRPESACNDRIYLLNQRRYAEAFYTFFRASKQNTKEKQTMQYAVVISVEADDVMDAIGKAKTDQSKIIAVNPAPQPRPPVQPAQSDPAKKG